MKTQKSNISKTRSNKQTIQTYNTIEDSPAKRKRQKKLSQKALTISDRQQKDMMVSRIQYLDEQYKKLFSNYKHNNKKTQDLQEQNIKLKTKIRRLKEQRQDQDRKIRFMSEQFNRTLGSEQIIRILKLKYEQLEMKYVLERQKRLNLQSEKDRWQNKKDRVFQQYSRILDNIQELKIEMTQ